MAIYLQKYFSIRRFS